MRPVSALALLAALLLGACALREPTHLVQPPPDGGALTPAPPAG